MTRMGITSKMLEILVQPTPRDEIKQRQGPGGRMLDYVDARYVMNKLDELGAENWQDRYVDRTDGSVRCGIGILIDGDWVWKWDVGAPSDIEPEKGSYSEAFKRAAVKWGVARDLYGHTPGGVSSTPPSRAPRSASPSPAGGAPSEPDYLSETFDHRTQAQRDEVATRDGFCPVHGLAWTLKPGGVSKTTGKAYDAFYACPSTERPYCREKPSKAFLAAQEAA